MSALAVLIDAKSGAMTPSTGQYSKRLSELRVLYLDKKALDNILNFHGDVIICQIWEFKQPDVNIFWYHDDLSR